MIKTYGIKFRLGVGPKRVVTKIVKAQTSVEAEEKALKQVLEAYPNSDPEFWGGKLLSKEN